MKVITYYQVIADSTAQTDCAFFIEFMLTAIEETLSESQIVTLQDIPQAVLEIMESNIRSWRSFANTRAAVPNCKRFAI